MNRPFRLHRLLAEWWLVALLSTGMVVFLVYDRTTDQLDKLAYDVALRLDQRDPDPRILVVAIDSPSLQQVGAWPWSRAVQGRLITALGEGRPKAIAYDVLLLENGDGDLELGRAMANANAPVFAPLLLDAPGRNGTPFDAVLPVEPVQRAIRAAGQVNLISDPDGLVRRIRLAESDGRRTWRHLMVLMSQAAEDGAAAKPVSQPVLIPFVGPAGRFPTIRASAVLRGELPAELLRDRLVIVGATAQGLGDHHPTPLGDHGRTMSGVEIMANLLDGLLSNRLISEAGLGPRIAAALIPLWLMLAAFRLFRPRAMALALAGLVVFIVGVSVVTLVALRLWLPPATGLVGLALVYPLWGWRSLAAVNSYMVGELEQLQAEPDALARPTAASTLDPVVRQAALLNEAITHVRDMRRFVADSLDQLPDAVLVVDSGGYIQLANSVAERLLASLQIDGSGRRDITPLFESLRPIDAFDQIVWPPAGTSSQTLSAADGRHFKLQIAPRHSADGEAVGRIVQISDISAIWAAEREREQILRFLTHDMRSPQASILAVIETAEAEEISAPVARRIEAYARRTLDLADGFVQLARAKTLQYRMEPVSLPDLLLDAIDDLWPKIVARGVRVDTIGQYLSLLVAGERSLLTRALINLIDNAVKYGPEGGRLICRLGVAESGGAPFAFCAITDEGPGVDADHLARLFEEFERGAAQIEARVGGVGLGLSFVHAVAARHGGRVWCESTPGQGATFTLALPRITVDDTLD